MGQLHLYLYAKLSYKGCISIRATNPEFRAWKKLHDEGLCSVLESGRAGTLIIHVTEKGENLLYKMIQSLEQRHT